MVPKVANVFSANATAKDGESKVDLESKKPWQAVTVVTGKSGYWSLLFAIVVCSLALSPVAAAEKVVIRHRTFEDFSKGSFGDGGTNIYVSSRGRVQLIPRWDINSDGYLDLVFTQDHNPLENVEGFIYWATKNGYHSLFPAFWKELPAFKLIRASDQRRKHITFLPAFGGGPVKIADLNLDGYPDIAFLNTIHNYYLDLEAYIYWGGPEGYSLNNRTELPTLFAKDLAIADLNRDGYPDIVFANWGTERNRLHLGYQNHLASFIYWGAPDGVLIGRRTCSV